MLIEEEEENIHFNLAERFILQTGKSLFLTGKAGTGKTTFLRKIKASGKKNTVVVAPTGVAAVNAGGTTIHSFFQLPFSPFIPEPELVASSNLYDRFRLLQNLRIESEKRKLFREMELLIIDEVSMVRCDVLDSIDIILRHFRQKERIPFGGVQVLFIGDLFQLPPVVQDSEWRILGEFYDSPFFFDAAVIRESPPLYVELKKIYRQRDPVFIEVLNRVRNNEITNHDLELLNQHYDPTFRPAPEDKFVTITTHNAKAEKINTDELNLLPGEPVYFDGIVEGDFPERSFPTERRLSLKKGAQVMFIKNDVERVRRYYNGKIGIVTRIENGQIFVTFPDEGEELEVVRETWRNVRYSYNRSARQIEEEEIGAFTQFPIRLAWAITIHKSQGLTFDKAIIDAGSSFAAGQVYVALSRCSSMEGIVMKSRLFRSAIMTDERVLDFAGRELNTDELLPIFEDERKLYVIDRLSKIYEWSIPGDEIKSFKEKVDAVKSPEREKASAVLSTLVEAVQTQDEVSDRFARQLRSMASRKEYDAILSRVTQATEYFVNVVDAQLITPLNDYREALKPAKRVKKLLRIADELESTFRSFQDLLRKGPDIASHLDEDDAA